MIGQTEALLHNLIHEIIERTTMPLKPRVKVKARGIPVPGVRVTAAGKIELLDTGARHPVVKARRQRTKDKVTGVKRRGA